MALKPGRPKRIAQDIEDALWRCDIGSERNFQLQLLPERTVKVKGRKKHCRKQNLSPLLPVLEQMLQKPVLCSNVHVDRRVCLSYMLNGFLLTTGFALFLLAKKIIYVPARNPFVALAPPEETLPNRIYLGIIEFSKVDSRNNNQAPFSVNGSTWVSQ